MKKFLSNNVAYPWAITKNLLFRGYIIVNDECLSGLNAINYLLSFLKYEDPCKLLFKLNGVFSFIYETNGYILFTVDRLRSLPLFYAIVDSELWIGDDTNSLVKDLYKITVSEVSCKEFISTNSFVSGENTLINELKQVCAAEICMFDKNNIKVSKKEYFRTEHNDFFDSNNYEMLKLRFNEAYKKTGKNMVTILAGRTAVIPLSGGADSRMILEMLKNENYHKVICYTYGKQGNKESEISRLVAKKYGYPWIMVPYTGKMWENLRNDSIIKEYYKFAFSYVSIPHLQDFLAVKILKEQGSIPNDSVFIPGHSGDLPTGNHIDSLYLHNNVSQQECFNSIYGKFYSHKSDIIKKRLLNNLQLPEIANPQEYSSAEEWFDTKERQAKYIVNSVRVYEFFGYEWLIPLWDNEQFNFWKQIPISLRYHRKLFYKIMDDSIPSTNDVTITKSIADFIRKIPGLRTLLRRFKRILNYKESSLMVEHYYPFKEYLAGCLFNSSSFSVLNLISSDIVKDLKKSCLEHEKK